jgi:tryptophan 2,3-dioxygenase
VEDVQVTEYLAAVSNDKSAQLTTETFQRNELVIILQLLVWKMLLKYMRQQVQVTLQLIVCQKVHHGLKHLVRLMTIF